MTASWSTHPAMTEKRRETVEGLNRRTSCSHRMYSSRCGTPGSQRVKATLSAPGEVTAEVGFGVLAGEPLKRGQVGSHGQPQLINERRRKRRSEGTEASSVKFIMI
jgi:hypothetical protein